MTTSTGHTARSTFGLGELAGVCAHYELGEIRSVHEFRRGSSRSPKVVLTTSSGRYLVKRRARGRDDPHRVAFCHELQLALHAAGFPTPRLVGTARGNNSMVQFNNRVYELFEFVEGGAFDRTPGPCKTAGRLLARLHRLVRTYQPRWPAPVWNAHADATIHEKLDAIAARGIAPTAISELHKLCSLAVEQATPSTPETTPETQLLHGDWHPGNMIFRGNRIMAVLDFDGAQSGHVIDDLANGLLQFSLTRVGTNPDDWPEALDAQRFSAFLQGYGAEALHLDLARLPALMAKALAAEVVVPIAVSGRFAGRDAEPFVQMALRKGQWLLEHADPLVALAFRAVEEREKP